MIFFFHAGIKYQNKPGHWWCCKSVVEVTHTHKTLKSEILEFTMKVELLRKMNNFQYLPMGVDGFNKEKFRGKAGRLGTYPHRRPSHLGLG